MKRPADTATVDAPAAASLESVDCTRTAYRPHGYGPSGVNAVRAAGRRRRCSMHASAQVARGRCGGRLARCGSREDVAYAWPGISRSSTPRSWVRDVIPSLGKARYRCELTVRWERYTICAISRLLSPSAAI